MLYEVITILICSMTGLAILCTGVWNDKMPESTAPLSEIQVRALPPTDAALSLDEDALRDAPAFAGEVTVSDGRVERNNFV